MTSAEIRQSFLDFFREKQHAIVPSSSLLPDAPNLLFTNAGMNQFVPIFLGQQKPQWNPPRVVDTQKCIRAGGKHNDLEDVGLDTYHHTFFEMLGNWSFGDYFKKEAIEWAWELLVERWKFPAQRLYATVYKPGAGEPSEFDQEAYDHWAHLFREADLDPAIHVLSSGKADNFWMMGDTGPCGPCSEVHMDLTSDGDTRGALVNKVDARCIEIWNLVFIQFNAQPVAGSGDPGQIEYVPLAARHVDTGMGFERVTGIIQGTKDLTDFSGTVSNYETDVFRPIFDELENLSRKKYASTLPNAQGSTPGSGVAIGGSPIEKVAASRGDQHASGVRSPEQIQVDVAFRVIADHIRALSFAIADGIIPSNEGRGYVLRRILRRAVRYGRTLGFHEPFFFKLADVVAKTIGDVFPEVRTQQSKIKETIRREEEAFNKTLDRGIELFEREVMRILGSAGASPAVSRASRDTSGRTKAPGPAYHKRRLPHFERPWAKYMVTFTTHEHRKLSPAECDITLQTILHDASKKYELYAACVMPDHVHLLIEPQIENDGVEGKPVFYTLSEILQTLKSVSSHRINKVAGVKGERVWENEAFDRVIRSERDLEEKFHYICRNPWDSGVAKADEDYPWLWTPQPAPVSREARDTAGEAPALPTTFQISGEFAFKLYDTYGFPLDLTELMARERRLTVDVAGFEKLMDEQRERARKAQKKEEISVEEGDLKAEPTRFLGYEFLEAEAVVDTVLPGKKPDEVNIVVDRTPLYAEMGGQVGDHGLLHVPGHDWTEVGQLRVIDTQKRGDVFVHRAELVQGRAPEPGEAVRISVDADRRKLIQGHHTVTHLLHWALHEVVSRDASQKGSYVGPDKLTFDFSSAPLTADQKRAVEKLVNEKIAENTPVSWTEIPFGEAKQRKDIIQFFGEKYGDTVRVLQIGGAPHALNGYSMELCGGTHVKSTGEIGPFRIVKEEAIAAGIRRIEAVTGEAARIWAKQEAARQQQKFDALARRKPDIATLPVFETTANTAEMLKQIDARAAYLEKVESDVREWEKKTWKAAEAELKSRAAQIANELATSNAGKNFCVADVPDADGKLLQGVAEALKTRINGPIFLVGTRDASVALVACVPKPLTAKFQANKLIQQIAPIVGGKGGGRADSAQGAGKDVSKVNEALAKARELLS
jgi:alanyl-tRNA synthetase/REP element-mobilizing transposase RayT